VDRIDHMISAIDTTAGLWQDTVKQAPVTAQTIVPNNKVHTHLIKSRLAKGWCAAKGDQEASLPDTHC
jgi:hypothetical protein